MATFALLDQTSINFSFLNHSQFANEQITDTNIIVNRNYAATLQVAKESSWPVTQVFTYTFIENDTTHRDIFRKFIEDFAGQPIFWFDHDAVWRYGFIRDDTIDIITTKDSESPDDIAIPTLVVENFTNVVCGYHLTHIKPIEIKGKFLFRFFQTQYLKSYFEISANGVTPYGLGVDKFKSALILVPPKEEQTQIVKHIETETAKINHKAAKTKKLITLLKEYKTALISEVVTGKIKVF